MLFSRKTNTPIYRTKIFFFSFSVTYDNIVKTYISLYTRHTTRVIRTFFFIIILQNMFSLFLLWCFYRFIIVLAFYSRALFFKNIKSYLWSYIEIASFHCILQRVRIVVKFVYRHLKCSTINPNTRH